jgi:hypothetical protein
MEKYVMKYFKKCQMGVVVFSIFLFVFGTSLSAAPAESRPCSLPGLKRAQEAIDALGDHLPAVAREHRLSTERLKELLLIDKDLGVDEQGLLAYTCTFDDGHDHGEEAPGALPSYPGTTGPIADYADTFKLHSLPGASKTIYLDFNGQYITGTPWNGGNPIDAVPWDFDGNPSSFNNAERAVLQLIWARVAEDYIPFEINVTTEEPNVSALIKSSGSDTQYGIRVVFTSTCDWGGGCTGVAYFGSFAWDTDTPCFVFHGSATWEKLDAETASHEVGHTLDLAHDGKQKPPVEYYGGHDDWAPIMGSSYYMSTTQWSKGEYPKANNTQDDLVVMQVTGDFGYRTDDHGDTIGSATGLGSGVNYGTIETNTDVDVFSFTLAEEGYQLINAWSDWPEGNLNIDLQLLDTNGSLITQVDNMETNGIESIEEQTLAAGQYYLRIEGVGGTGYSDYASLGQYYVEVRDTAPTPIISQAGWTLHYVDSEETSAEDTPAIYAFDGNTSSIWHTEWSSSNPPHPHEIQINLGGSYSIEELDYLPRQDSENGRIADYEIYVSSNATNWTLVDSGTFFNVSLEQSSVFTATTGSYISLVALSEVNGNPWTSVAEINVRGTEVGGGDDTTPPTPNPATFVSPPAAVSDTEITMTATTGSDATGPVEYFFDETSLNLGGTDSGWVTNPVYNDTELSPSTQYTYTVQIRDSVTPTPNVGTASTPANATTNGSCTPTDMHIEAVVCAEVNCGQGKKNGSATVTIYDDCGNPVTDALVDGNFTGDFSESFYDVSTNGSGQAVFTTAGCVRRPSFTFTVTDVTDTLPYDSNDDVTDNCSG